MSRRNIITTQANGASSVYAADIDGDGDIDVLSASSSDNKISWYENMDGKGTFSIQNIISTQANGASSVYAADIDGDGDIDVLSASSSDNKISWYENMDGKGTFSIQNIISTQANGASSVYAADIDGDGDIDVLSASSSDNKISWYENMDGKGTFSIQNIISTQANGASSVYAADIDGDGDIDVLSASTKDTKISWYENINGVFSKNIQASLEKMDASNIQNLIFPENGTLVVHETLSIPAKNTIRRLYTNNQRLNRRFNVTCKQSKNSCLTVLAGGHFEGPFHLEYIAFDSLYAQQSSVVHIKSIQGLTPPLVKYGNPVVLKSVHFQNVIVEQYAVIVSDASPLTLINTSFINISAPKLVDLGYGETLYWAEPSAFASIDSICSTNSHLWLPLVIQNAKKLNVRVNESDIVWNENVQPVVAYLRKQPFGTSAAIIQVRSLASREAKFRQNECLSTYPNCCKRVLLDDITKAKVNAGILQYGDEAFTVQAKANIATLGVINDLDAPSYIQPCPVGTSWQWEGDYIAKCKPIVCAAGTEVKDGSYSCSPCNIGFFKSIGNIDKCTPCPRNTYGSVNDTKKCFDCPKNSNSPIGATSKRQCKCTANYFKDNDECKQCPPNAKLWYSEGAVDNVCKCYKNHYKTGSGVSMQCRECPLNANSQPNSTSIDQCECNSNYFKHNNQCKQCPNNAIQLHSSGAPDDVCIYKTAILEIRRVTN
eukprot:g3125.t1